ncbi:MAG: hypothetical protein RLZZ15_1054 [Verrucomicrobiota bacterium]
MNTLELILLGALALSAVCWWRERAARREAEARHAAELAALSARHDAELRAQTERTAALFDRMVEGVIVADAAGRVRLANRAAGEFFGFTAPAAGRSLLEATRHHEVAALVARLETEPEVLNHELRLDGVAAARTLQVNALALRAPDGARDGALLVFHDLTRLRQLEAVRQDFVANVSHELRTPLSLIKGAAETLLDGAKNDPVVAERFLAIIDRHANRLTHLIDDLLLLARLDSGRVELALATTPLRDAAQSALDDHAAVAGARVTRLVNAVPATLTCAVDADRLHQVLSNLIDNAIKYGRAGGEIIVAGRALHGGGVELSVRDDGPGIAPEACARIFERFYRADKARSREQGGTGLGLAIVKNVMAAHGGEARVASAPGAGTEFFLTFPAGGAGG